MHEFFAGDTPAFFMNLISLAFYSLLLYTPFRCDINYICYGNEGKN